jgi:threonine dehydratase
VAAAMEAGEVVKVVMPGPTLADGLAVPTVGPRSFEVCRNRVDKLVTVSEKDISVALLRLVELEKLIQEGAGAAGIAAVLAGKFPELKDKNVAVLLCGGNIDTSTLGNVLERGLVNDSRLIRFSGTCVKLSQIQAHCFITQLVTVRTDYSDCLFIHITKD